MDALLERERELLQIREALVDGVAGGGRLLVIEAEAGLGKTRLVSEAQALAAPAGVRVVSARATELERAFPFGIVRQLFQPDIANRSAPEVSAIWAGAAASARSALGVAEGVSRDRFAVLHGLYWLTVGLAQERPLLLTVDDAQWADAASLEYLMFLLPRLGELPLVVLVATRPDEAHDGPLAALLTDTIVQRLMPAPLSLQAASELVGERLGAQPDAAFATACHEVTGGNPFLLGELSQTLTEENIEPTAEQAVPVSRLAPESIRRHVLRRLARLSEAARAVARAVSVLGDDSAPRLVAALGGLREEAVLEAADELRAASILAADGRLRFVHPLTRNVVYSELSIGERDRAHAAAARLLSADSAGPDQVATHLLAASARGDRGVVEILTRAAERALERGAPESAIAYADRAFREPPPDDLHMATVRLLVSSAFRAGRVAALKPIEDELLASLTGQPPVPAASAAEVVPWMVISGHAEEGAALLEQAIEGAVGEGNLDLAVSHEAHLVYLTQRPPADGEARLERYHGRLPPDTPRGRLALALRSWWSATSDGSAADSADLAWQALADGQIFEEQPELPHPIQAGIVLIRADRLDEAHHVAARALAVAERRGAVVGLASAWFLRGFVAQRRGHLAEAEADSRQAVDAARLSGTLSSLPPFTALLVEILSERGDLEGAAAVLEEALPEDRVPDGLWVAPLLRARGLLRLAEGRVREAADDLVDLGDRMQQAGMATGGGVPVASLVALALGSLGESSRARDFAAAGMLSARRWGAPSTVSTALTAQGLLEQGRERLDLLADAVGVLDGSPVRLYRARALAELGAAMRRANQRSAAREPLREALELARRCGAATLARRAYDELLATGETVRRHSPIGVESLTPSERRVSRMAASGMTNRQIAEALFLTIKTIESHLAAAFDKLGVHSRGELARALTEAHTTSSKEGKR